MYIYIYINKNPSSSDYTKRARPDLNRYASSIDNKSNPTEQLRAFWDGGRGQHDPSRASHKHNIKLNRLTDKSRSIGTISRRKNEMTYPQAEYAQRKPY